MIYAEHEKQIYTSPLNTQHDPIQTVNRLTAVSGGLFNEWLALWYGADTSASDRAKAALALADAGRKVFGFAPLTTEGGYGDGSVLEVVHHFAEYVAKK